VTCWCEARVPEVSTCGQHEAGGLQARGGADDGAQLRHLLVLGAQSSVGGRGVGEGLEKVEEE
jgi:hypothetical protein